MNIKPLAKGLLTFIPGVRSVLPERETGGTISAAYCYNVWLKHLTFLWENGVRSVPSTLAELGPGDSIGVGLAAMLSGVDNYYALDVIRHANVDRNLQIFEDLVALFRTRAARSAKGWPDFDNYLDEKLFPSHILTDELLGKSLSDERVSMIRDALVNPEVHGSRINIKYMVPWSSEKVIEEETIDVILSHAVLEHIVDLDHTYNSLYRWLKPGGVMSHQIDFSSHGLSREWNGYRAYPELLWKMIMGKRTYLINRQPCSVHTDLMSRNNLRLVCLLKNHREDGIERSKLSAQWKSISDDDLRCSGAFIQARK